MAGASLVIACHCYRPLFWFAISRAFGRCRPGGILSGDRQLPIGAQYFWLGFSLSMKRMLLFHLGICPGSRFYCGRADCEQYFGGNFAGAAWGTRVFR